MAAVGVYIVIFCGVTVAMLLIWNAANERRNAETREGGTNPPSVDETNSLWAGMRRQLGTRESLDSGNSFVVRMAEAIENHRIALETDRLSFGSSLTFRTDARAAFQVMMNIRSEYWEHSDLFRGGARRTDRIERRLNQMIEDEIERPSRERRAVAASLEKTMIENASILKGDGVQAIVDFAPEGGLVRISTAHHGAVHFLRVHNGTVNPDGSREEYAICVPNECRTVKAALAWTYGIEPDKYAEVVRT